MKTVGIICEYNPFHLGHKKQLDIVRSTYGEDCAIVCLMSGSFVQRGMPAIFDKSLRARAAITCGADLVLELPVTSALSSAEGFAAGGVQILSGLCDALCFGTETGDVPSLMQTARTLLSPEFSDVLHLELETGKSFPAARQAALERMGADASLLTNPNDILAVEYCKAIIAQNSSLIPLPIHRMGSYHDTAPDPRNPSATAIRHQILNGESWKEFVPEEVRGLFENAPKFDLSAGERAMLYRLRTMTDEEFEALPYGSEGLWRRLMHASRSHAGLEDILTATKSKRYTRSRLDRMVMCAFLGITAQDLETSVPYTRILAFSNAGRTILKNAKGCVPLLHIGETHENPYWSLEQRCDDLHGLFRLESPQCAGGESQRRVILSPAGSAASPPAEQNRSE